MALDRSGVGQGLLLRVPRVRYARERRFLRLWIDEVLALAEHIAEQENRVESQIMANAVTSWDDV